jgi:AraC-like DNA-binding protein
MQFLTHTTGDIDEAREILGRYFYSNDVDLLSARTGWQARFEITPPGPVTIGDLGFGTDVRIRYGELGAYHVDVPLSGSLIWRQGNDEPRRATTATAAVFQPVGDTVLDRWQGNCRLLAVKIDKTALENTLSDLIDAPVRSPVRFGPVLDTTCGRGAGWLRLLGLVAADAGRPDGLLRHPVIGAGLQESLIAGLLIAANHQYREQIDRYTPPTAAPGSVRRAVEAMHADPARPFTVGRLAEIAGVGPRALQISFQRYVGTSPMTYLRQLRLARAHDDLRHSDPAAVTVAQVALRNGFPHFGRFAAAYRDRFGVSPRQTLRE